MYSKIRRIVVGMRDGIRSDDRDFYAGNATSGDSERLSGEQLILIDLTLHTNGLSSLVLHSGWGAIRLFVQSANPLAIRSCLSRLIEFPDCRLEFSRPSRSLVANDAVEILKKRFGEL